MSDKTRIADTAALDFALQCARRGANVAFPMAEKCPYNIIVDSGGTLFRVRAKNAGVERSTGTLVVNSQKRIPNSAGGGPSTIATPYEKADIDVLAANFNGSWYLFNGPEGLPANLKMPANATKLRPDLERKKEAWDVLQLADSGV